MTKTYFGSIKVGESFIFGYYIFKKISAYQAVNCHNFTTRYFKNENRVENA